MGALVAIPPVREEPRAGDRNLGTFSVGQDDLLALLKAAAAGPVLVRLAHVWDQHTVPLEPGMELVDVRHDWETRAFTFLVEGEGLPAVGPGMIPPHITGGGGAVRLYCYSIPREVL